MPDELKYPPDVVRAQILQSVDCIVAISIWNDDDANALAESFGARVLLDKVNLASALIPTIKLFCNGTDTRPAALASENVQTVANPIPKDEVCAD
jgi:hypothetical protein